MIAKNSKSAGEKENKDLRPYTNINLNEAPETQPVDIDLTIIVHTNSDTNDRTDHDQDGGREHAEQDELLAPRDTGVP
jgi:hypothetical protein